MTDGSHFARERRIAFTLWHLDAVSGSHPPHLFTGVKRKCRSSGANSAFDPKADMQHRLARICEEAVRRAQASLRLFVTLHPRAANGLQLQILRHTLSFACSA